MRLSVLFSAILVLAASTLTYAAPYGTLGTFLDIEQRSGAQEEHELQPIRGTGAASTSGSHG